MKRLTPIVLPALAITALLAVSACSSSFGGGTYPPTQAAVVVPPGATAVCMDGTRPPC